VTLHVLRRPGKLVPELLEADRFSIGHHGASADWPEMSMEAYRQAVDHGVDALEVSLARSADGVWFGLHDATLDRTSGTTNFVASDHPWAEIQQLRINPTGRNDTSGAPQAYLPFEDLVSTYAATHTIFVDPKVVPRAHYPELLALMDAATEKPNDNFIAKAYCTTTVWADAAHSRGYRTWGYYYGREMAAGRTPLPASQSSWDLLGLDIAASEQEWSAVRALEKPVIAHIIATPADSAKADRAGARGQMVAAVREVLTT
jgi:hypothetical protein